MKKKKTFRDEGRKKELTVRLNIIEGQIKGIKKMIMEDEYCVNIITQVNAASAALNSFSKQLLSDHIKSCVVRDIQNGDINSALELSDLISKVTKV